MAGLIVHVWTTCLHQIFFEHNLIKIPKDKRFGFIISSKVPLSGTEIKNLKQDFLKNHGQKLEIKNKVLRHII